jgi:hypothetical protein
MTFQAFFPEKNSLSPIDFIADFLAKNKRKLINFADSIFIHFPFHYKFVSDAGH